MYLLTQNYLQEEYQQTAYTCNVYFALGGLSSRLRYMSRESVVSSSRVKIEFTFLNPPAKGKGKKKADEGGDAKAPKKRTAGGSSKKGKSSAVVDSDEGDLSSGEESEILITDYIKPVVTRVDSDDEYSSDSIEDDWEVHPVRDKPPPRKRRRMGEGFKMIQEGGNEVMVLSSD